MPWQNSVRLSFVLAGALCAACGSDSSSEGGSSGSSGSPAASGAASQAGSGASAAGAGNASGSGGAPGSAGALNSAGGASGAGTAGSSNAGANSGGSTSLGGASGSGGKAGTAGSSGSAGAAGADNCPAVDPLKTNNAKQDAYDCVILSVSKKWGMPDPMIVKSQVQQESGFDVLAISGDSPCGTMQGWTDAESKSFGLIQSTPACGEATTARLPNGHPNLTKDMSDPLWANSVFNPTINLDEGVKTDVDSLKELKKKYPNCTDVQYNMMSAGAFNSGTGAITGCAGYNARAQEYVTFITQHYQQFAKAAGWPDPY